ncbi:hypothetical protein HanRHA438_Chr01g0018791 [Helianthus annuus]|nr:hypothetical protein HanIR_Chr01g0019901 [Helianthus annuus]KAJ0947706.1 hypothetical protein HanRHA438_Chr01g0018791 [Helianthus annuus]
MTKAFHVFMKCRYLWKPEDDQAQRRTEHDTVTCFRTSPRCKFYTTNFDHIMKNNL